jgi:hypothetical protein
MAQQPELDEPELEIRSLLDARVIRLTAVEAKSLSDYLERVHGIGAVVAAPRPDERRVALSRVVGQIRALERIKGDAPPAPAREDPSAYGRIRRMLVAHLGSESAADAWLTSTKTGYPGSALDAIHSGKADQVGQDLEAQGGPNPSYA